MKILSISLLLLACLAGGCSGGTDTKEVKLPDGTDAKVSTNKDGSGMTVEGNGVKAEVGGQLQVSQDDLHAPFYPGAIVDVNRSMKVKAEKEESALVTMSSTDTYEKVKAFYEEKLPGIKFTEIKSADNINTMGETKADNGGRLAVTIARKGAQGSIEITIGYGKETK